jgi:sugar lactone lactonase YvrE
MRINKMSMNCATPFLLFFLGLVLPFTAHSGTFITGLTNPTGIAIRPNERSLYVKSGVRRKRSLSIGIRTLLVPLAFLLLLLFLPRSGISGSFISGLAAPTGLAIHPTERLLYVKSGTSGRVWSIPITQNGRAGNPSVATDSFTPDLNIVFDAAGNLYGLETGTHNLYRLDSNNTVTSTVLSSNYLRAFNSGIAVEGPGLPSSRLFIAGNEWHSAFYLGSVVINEVEPYQEVTRIGNTTGEFRFLLYRQGVGSIAGTKGDSLVNINASNGSCNVLLGGLIQPNGIAEDRQGNLYVADSGSGQIFKLTTLGQQVEIAKNLVNPTGLVFDSETGLLLVSETGAGRITTLPVGMASSGKVALKIKDPTGKWGATVTAPKGTSPNTPAACEDGTGNLYVFISKLDNTIAMNRRSPAGQWGKWANVSGTMRTSSSPSATYTDGKILLYVRGLDDKVWERIYNTGTKKWSAWKAVAGMTTPANPEAVTDDSGNTYLIIRGMR